MVVTFTDATASRSFEAGTALVGTKPGYTYRLDVPSVAIVLAGPVSLLDEVDLAELVVEIPVGDLEVGDNDVMPVVRPPRGLTIARITPETVRVTVGQPS